MSCCDYKAGQKVRLVELYDFLERHGLKVGDILTVQAPANEGDLLHCIHPPSMLEVYLLPHRVEPIGEEPKIYWSEPAQLDSETQERLENLRQAARDALENLKRQFHPTNGDIWECMFEGNREYFDIRGGCWFWPDGEEVDEEESEIIPIRKVGEA